ncbi:hypothetical protein ACOSQ3_018781 [Xanthoceras sorbifolium]
MPRAELVHLLLFSVLHFTLQANEILTWDFDFFSQVKMLFELCTKNTCMRWDWIENLSPHGVLVLPCAAEESTENYTNSEKNLAMHVIRTAAKNECSRADKDARIRSIVSLPYYTFLVMKRKRWNSTLSSSLQRIKEPE